MPHLCYKCNKMLPNRAFYRSNLARNNYICKACIYERDKDKRSERYYKAKDALYKSSFTYRLSKHKQLNETARCQMCLIQLPKDYHDKNKICPACYKEIFLEYFHFPTPEHSLTFILNKLNNSLTYILSTPYKIKIQRSISIIDDDIEQTINGYLTSKFSKSILYTIDSSKYPYYRIIIQS